MTWGILFLHFQKKLSCRVVLRVIPVNEDFFSCLPFITNRYRWKCPLSSLTICCIFHVLIHLGSTYRLSRLFLTEKNIDTSYITLQYIFTNTKQGGAVTFLIRFPTAERCCVRVTWWWWAWPLQWRGCRGRRWPGRRRDPALRKLWWPSHWDLEGRRRTDRHQ